MKKKKIRSRPWLYEHLGFVQGEPIDLAGLRGMIDYIELSALLDGTKGNMSRKLGLFALLNLGIVESLVNGALSSVEATRFFFNAQNCLYVRKKLRDKVADEIMSHGVQLHDLFEVLPEQEAQQEFQRELGSIRSLCLSLLDQHQLVA